jgi:hypothetical protein
MRGAVGFVAAAIMLASLMLQGGVAQAGQEWCSDDPIVNVLGGQFSLTAKWAGDRDTDSVAYVIEVPANAGEVRVSYPNANAVATTVLVVHTGKAWDGVSPTIAVATAVTVTSSESGRVEVELSGPNVEEAEYTGTTGKKLRFNFAVAIR